MQVTETLSAGLKREYKVVVNQVVKMVMEAVETKTSHVHTVVVLVTRVVKMPLVNHHMVLMVRTHLKMVSL